MFPSWLKVWLCPSSCHRKLSLSFGPSGLGCENGQGPTKRHPSTESLTGFQAPFCWCSWLLGWFWENRSLKPSPSQSGASLLPRQTLAANSPPSSQAGLSATQPAWAKAGMEFPPKPPQFQMDQPVQESRSWDKPRCPSRLSWGAPGAGSLLLCFSP